MFHEQLNKTNEICIPKCFLALYTQDIILASSYLTRPSQHMSIEKPLYQNTVRCHVVSWLPPPHYLLKQVVSTNADLTSECSARCSTNKTGNQTGPNFHSLELQLHATTAIKLKEADCPIVSKDFMWLVCRCQCGLSPWWGLRLGTQWRYSELNSNEAQKPFLTIPTPLCHCYWIKLHFVITFPLPFISRLLLFISHSLPYSCSSINPLYYSLSALFQAD